MSPAPRAARHATPNQADGRPVVGAARSDKREAILAAALELFVERGFHGTAVPEVAERARVGAGTIYRYFASKEALVNALFQREKAALIGRVFGGDLSIDTVAGVQAASTRELFRTLWMRMAAYVVEEPLAFAFLELHNHGSYLDDVSIAIEQRVLAFGVGFVELAQRRGELRQAPPLLLIGLVLGAFVGLVRRSAECGLEIDHAAWSTAEQCMWEAVRS